MRWMPRSVLVLALLLTAVTALAQFGRGGRGYPIIRGLPDEPGGFTFCRLAFQTVRSDPSGSGWDIEYPRGEYNLMTRLSQLTHTRISKWGNGEPGHTVVVATDRELFQCPFLMMASPGTAGFNDTEAAQLRQYLLKGGFLWADDFWGNASWAHWEGEIGRILPEYQIVDLPLNHPIFSTFYWVDEVPQIPSLNRWRPGMSTSELGAESVTPHLRGIIDEEGRLLVVMTHNTDIADGWEREGDLESYFLLFSANAYAVGVNVAIWSMTH
jgi:hypothetical protein